MGKAGRFSPFTVSQSAVLGAYNTLVGSRGPSNYTITVPSVRSPGNGYRYRPSPLEDLPDAMGSWKETIRQYVKEWNQETINEVVGFLKEALSESTGKETTFDVTFHIDWDGSVHLDTITPEGTPYMGQKSDYIASYTEKITIPVIDSRIVFGDLQKIKDMINQKMNIEPKLQKEFQQSMKQVERGIREQMDRVNRGDYRDPPTPGRLEYIGGIA